MGGGMANLLPQQKVTVSVPELPLPQEAQRNTNHRREEPIQIAFYCHFCCFHTYEVAGNLDHYDVRFCTTRDCFSGQRVPMEVIFLTRGGGGNQRLREIICRLRESTASSLPSAPIAVIPPHPITRPFRLSSIIHGGVKLVDLVLQVDIVDLATEHQGQLCGICNDNFIVRACNQSKESGDSSTSVYHVNGCACPQSQREFDADTGRSSILRLPCGHSYHQSCILPWFTNHSTCPYCRSLIKAITSVPTVERLAAAFDEEQLTRKIIFAMVQDAKNDECYGRRCSSRANLFVNATPPPPPPPRIVHTMTHETHSYDDTNWNNDAVKEDESRSAKQTSPFISLKTSLKTMRVDLAQMLYHSLFRLLIKGALISTNQR